jgi:heme exporter protein C
MTAASPPAPIPAAPKRVVDWFVLLALAGMAAVYVRAIFFTPPELIQGYSQKILYVHAPSAVAAYVAFGLMGLMSVIYLWMRDPRSDRMGEAAAEVAVMFLTVTCITGAIWAKPIWGTWWRWQEPRLTLALFLWVVGVGYLVLRRAFDDEDTRARYTAVLGVMSIVLIPFVHLSVLMFSRNSIHPPPMFIAPPTPAPLPGVDAPPPAMPEVMAITLVLGFIMAALLCIALLRARYALGTQRARLAALEDRR